MLHEPTRFDALINEPWVPARVEDAIAAIVADAGAAFDPTALWPAHEWDAREKSLPLSGLYVGAAGVVWALDELQRRGHAESSRDLAAAVVRAVELERATPDFSEDEHYRPGALISGDTGALLVAFRLTRDPALADDVHALVRGNVDNPTDDISWGAPGTLLAALAMGEWTGERRWDEAARESATALRQRRGGGSRSGDPRPGGGAPREADALRLCLIEHARGHIGIRRFHGTAGRATRARPRPRPPPRPRRASESHSHEEPISSADLGSSVDEPRAPVVPLQRELDQPLEQVCVGHPRRLEELRVH